MGGLVNPIIFRAGHYSFWNYIGVSRTHEHDVKNIILTLSERVLRKRERYLRNKLFLSYWNNKVLFMADSTVYIRLNFYNSKKEVWWVWRAHVQEKKNDFRYLDKCLNVLVGVLRIKVKAWLKRLVKRSSAVYKKIQIHPSMLAIRRRFYAIIRLEKEQAYYRAQRILQVIRRGLYAKYIRRHLPVESEEGFYLKFIESWHGLYIAKGLYKMKKTMNRVIKKRLDKRRGEVLHQIESLYKRSRNHSFLTTFLILGAKNHNQRSTYVRNKLVFFGECFLGLNILYNKYYKGLSNNWVSLDFFMKKVYYQLKRRDNLYSELRVDLNRLLFQGFYNSKENCRTSIRLLLKNTSEQGVQFNGDVFQHYQTSLKYLIKRMHSYSLLNLPKLFQVSMCLNSTNHRQVIHQFKKHKKEFKEKYIKRFQLNLYKKLIRNLLKRKKIILPTKSLFALNEKYVFYNVNIVGHYKLKSIYRLIQGARLRSLLTKKYKVINRYRILMFSAFLGKKLPLSRRRRNKQIKAKILRYIQKKQKYIKKLSWAHDLDQKVLSKVNNKKFLLKTKSKRTTVTKQKKKLADKSILTKEKYGLRSREEKNIFLGLDSKHVKGLSFVASKHLKKRRRFATLAEVVTRKKEERFYRKRAWRARFSVLMRYYSKRSVVPLYQTSILFSEAELGLFKNFFKNFLVRSKFINYEHNLLVSKKRYVLVFYTKLKSKSFERSKRFIRRVLKAQWGKKKNNFWFPKRWKRLFNVKYRTICYVTLNKIKKNKEYLLVRKNVKSLNVRLIKQLERKYFFKGFSAQRAWVKVLGKVWKKKKYKPEERYLFLKKSERYKEFRVKALLLKSGRVKMTQWRQEQQHVMRKHYGRMLVSKLKEMLKLFRFKQMAIFAKKNNNLTHMVDNLMFMNQIKYKLLKLSESKIPLGIFGKKDVKQLFSKLRRYHDVLSPLNYRIFKAAKKKEALQLLKLKPTRFSRAFDRMRPQSFELWQLKKEINDNFINNNDLFVIRLLRYMGKYGIKRHYALINDFVLKLFSNKFFYRKKFWNVYQKLAKNKLDKLKKDLFIKLSLRMQKVFVPRSKRFNNFFKKLRSTNKKLIKIFVKKNLIKLMRKIKKIKAQQKVRAFLQNKNRSRGLLVQESFVRWDTKNFVSDVTGRFLVKKIVTSSLYKKLKKAKEARKAKNFAGKGYIIEKKNKQGKTSCKRAKKSKKSLKKVLSSSTKKNKNKGSNCLPAVVSVKEKTISQKK